MKLEFQSLSFVTLVSTCMLVLVLLLISTNTVAGGTPQFAEPNIYFTEAPGKIVGIDAQGQNETEIAGPLPLQRMAYDSAAQKVYGATREGAIRRMNPDGTGLETLLDNLDNPQDLQLDPANGKMYWRSAGTIQKADLDGSGLETIVPFAEFGGGDFLRLDAARGKIYWIRIEEDIRRANVDGTGVETIVPGSSSDYSECLVLDRTNQKIYWVNDLYGGTAFIGRSDFDGSNEEHIITLGSTPYFSCPIIDPVAGLIYWGFSNEDAIKVANLDGSNVQTLIPGVESPKDLAFGPDGKLYWAENQSGTRAISRADIDGNNIETLATDLRQVFLAGPLFIVLGNVQKLLWNYWDRELTAADLDGSDVSTLFRAPAYAYGIALDEQNGKLYWSELDSIARSNVDGTDVEFVVTGIEYTDSVALGSSKIYWAQNNSVKRANLDGSNVETLYTYASSPTFMDGLVVDETNDKLYWSESRSGLSYTGTLWQSNLDGSDAKAFVSGLGEIHGITINYAGTVVYAINGAGSKIQRINLSDKSVTDLLTGAQASGKQIVLDEGRGHLYYTSNSDGGVVRRINTDGSGVTTIYDGPAYPFYLTIPRSKPNGIFSDSFEDVF